MRQMLPVLHDSDDASLRKDVESMLERGSKGDELPSDVSAPHQYDHAFPVSPH